jgi:hypothetical protein
MAVNASAVAELTSIFCRSVCSRGLRLRSQSRSPEGCVGRSAATANVGRTTKRVIPISKDFMTGLHWESSEEVQKVTSDRGSVKRGAAALL